MNVWEWIAWRDAIDACHNVPAEPGWIPVETRLPEISGEHMTIIRLQSGARILTSIWYSLDSGWSVRSKEMVTHWQTWPDPPTE